MLAKVPEKRSDNRSSFKQLISYMTRSDDQPSIAKDEIMDLLSNEASCVQSTGGISCYHNCLSLDTAHLEMQAVAHSNPRVKDPIYHLIVSWREDENPSDDIIRNACIDTLHAMGFEGHQYVIAVHRDTENVHAHIIANKVNPESFKAVNLSHDFYRLDKVMRELEIKYGFTHDVGPYVVNYDGNIPIIVENKHASFLEKNPNILPSKYSTIKYWHDGAWCWH